MDMNAKTDQEKTLEPPKVSEKAKQFSPLATPLPPDDKHVYLKLPKALLDRPDIKKTLGRTK